jgi:ethanolaminephosphotransferase
MKSNNFPLNEPLDVNSLQITLSGLIIVVLNFTSLLLYDPAYVTQKGGATGPPKWLYFT